MISQREYNTKWAWIGTHTLNIGFYLFNYKLELQVLAGLGGKLSVMGERVGAIFPKGGGDAFEELQTSELREFGNRPLGASHLLIWAAESAT